MFVFYDTETTGLDKDFTQILQIALVFTDDDLNILSSKKIECRTSPWVVPSPGALLTTGFEPDDLKNNKHSHYEMMQEIDSWIRSQHWPVTFVGYNSIGYDEPILAQNLYHNLLDPQLTSSKNNANDQSNGRADVMILVKAVAAYMPGVLKLKTMNDYGTPSLSLKNVAQQNGVQLSDDDAHDAMNDIKATIGVAKLLQKAAPQVWQQLMKLSTVDGVNEFLKTHTLFTHLNGGKSAVTTCLGDQALYDLSVDPAPYLNMTVEQLKDVFLSKDKAKPLALVRKENQPVLMPIDLSAAVIPVNYNESLYAARAQALQSNKTFLDNLVKAALLAKQAGVVPAPPHLPELAIDQKLAAPLKAKIEQWSEEFRSTDNWREAAKLIEDFYVRFKDDLAADPALSRFVKFAGRIVYEHAPEELSAEKQEAMKKHIAARVLNPDLKAPYMTVAKARKELEQIEQEREGSKKWKDVTDGQIRSLKLYYTSLEKTYAEAHAAPPPVNDNKHPPKPDAGKNSGPKV
jgi:exodeoxyribonuclease-1